MRLMIEVSVQLSKDGTRRLPEWLLDVQCPICASLDVDADRARLVESAVQTPER